MSLRKIYLIMVLVLGATACATSTPDAVTNSDEESITDGNKKPIDPKSKSAKVHLEKYPAQEQ